MGASYEITTCDCCRWLPFPARLAQNVLTSYLLLEKTRKVVQKYYPKATFTTDDDLIHFEFNTRSYMIHHPTLDGYWQDAVQEPGPQKGGIWCDMELRSGTYGGQAVVPQSFDERYFTLLLMAPNSKNLDRHLYVHLKYPRDVPPGFIQDFEELVNGFAK